MSTVGSSATRPWRGAVVGGALFLALMLVLAAVAVAVAVGWIGQGGGGTANRTDWLAVEVRGRALEGLVAGAVALRVGRSPRDPLVLSVAVLTAGLVQAAELLDREVEGRGSGAARGGSRPVRASSPPRPSSSAAFASVRRPPPSTTRDPIRGHAPHPRT